MKTYSMKQDEIAKDWLVVDAEDIPLGRLATQVATFLRGKHKPTFTAHLDMGDNVIVLNAAKVKLTGQKLDRRSTCSHTGYMGGQRVTTDEEADGEAARRSRHARGEGHAAQDPSGPQAADEPEGLRRAPSIRTRPQQPKTVEL